MRENFALRYAFNMGLAKAAKIPASTVFWSALRLSDTVDDCHAREKEREQKSSKHAKGTKLKPRSRRPLSVEHRHVGGTGERACHCVATETYSVQRRKQQTSFDSDHACPCGYHPHTGRITTTSVEDETLCSTSGFRLNFRATIKRLACEKGVNTIFNHEDRTPDLVDPKATANPSPCGN